MPRTRLAWASWNYEINRAVAGASSTATHYWMNSLQGVSTAQDYFVSINRPEAIDPQKVLRTIPYEHPLFNLGAARAQADLPQLNAAGGRTGTYFAGSYFRYGFHEDAFLSSVQLSAAAPGPRSVGSLNMADDTKPMPGRGPASTSARSCTSRFAPKAHRFSYRIFMLAVDLDELGHPGQGHPLPLGQSPQSLQS